MDWMLKNHVCELGYAENNLIQVLLTEFSLFLDGPNKAILEVEFDHTVPTIRRREAKKEVKNAMPNFQRKSIGYQDQLDSLLLANDINEFIFNDPDFVFRYASGGTLPIISLEGKEYYCLFYRDVDPIGWNIANGSTDSFEELLKPDEAIQRELQEELILVDLVNKKKYLFESGEKDALDLPEFRQAFALWQEKYLKGKLFYTFETIAASENWIDGPDTLNITINEDQANVIPGCFLNINATDFGIEIDKIAEIKINREMTLLDGEVVDNKLLNRPIGLFPIENFDKIGNKYDDFYPERIFYSGRPLQHRTNIDDLVHEKFWPRLLKEGIRTESLFEDWKIENHKYKLCPVTYRIIKRNKLRIDNQTRLFISHSSQDIEFTKKLMTELELNNYPCFFAPRDMTSDKGIRDVIRKNLELSNVFLIVYSNNYTKSQWANFEIELALEKQRRQKEINFIPIKIDDSIMGSDESLDVYIRSIKNIIDFIGHKTNNLFKSSFENLINNLQLINN